MVESWRVSILQHFACPACNPHPNPMTVRQKGPADTFGLYLEGSGQPLECFKAEEAWAPFSEPPMRHPDPCETCPRS